MPSKAPHTGPGRASQRARAVARPSSRPAARAERAPRGQRRLTRPEEPAPLAPGRVVPRFTRSVGVTRRAIALMVVLAVLVISYASSMRVYLRQERELATAQQQIAERTAANADLQFEIDRWKDQNFVRAQARQRLGWVIPGETGYRVIDENGQPLMGGVSISSTSTLPAGEHPTTWWERMAGSMAAADEPLVPVPQAPQVVAPSPTPTPTSTPTPTPARKKR